MGYGCVALTQTALPVLITGLLGMPLAALTSVPGIIIIVIIASLLWTMGVHGTVAVYAAIAAPLMQYYATNYANHEAGQALVFMPIALFTGALRDGIILEIRTAESSQQGSNRARSV